MGETGKSATTNRREYLREYQRRRYSEDPEWRARCLAAQKRTRLTNPEFAERGRERARAWRAARTPEQKTAFQKWLNEYKKERRARLLAEQGDDFLRREALGRQVARYGITQSAYLAMLDRQGGVCAICRQPETAIIKGRVAALGVDHDHSCCPGKRACGKCLRGLLCGKCNTMLGGARDDPAILQAALDYLGR